MNACSTYKIMKLFVDCDDTLGMYCRCDTECASPMAHPNRPLIAAVKKWYAENPDGEVIIWSGGGDWYAQQFAEKFFPDTDITVHFSRKHNGVIKLLVKEGDIVVDDQEIVSKGIHYFPNDFVVLMGADNEGN